ncbi:MAG: hypothetical protein B7Y35_06125 [Sphingomonadales bacterium 28-64-96]|nr:MAG: hypothetical protein B7Y35_06125 [Sphingomonadales bacterium 28-64-96]
MSNGFLVRPLVPTLVSSPLATPAAPTTEADVLNDMIGVQYVSGRSAAGDALDIDFGVATAIDTIALLQTNGAAGTWSILGATTRSGLDTAPAIFGGTFAAGTTAPTSGRTHALAVLGAAATWRWWRIGFAGLSAPIEIGRLVMGRRFQPEVNFSFGAALGVADLAPGEFSRRAVWLPGDGGKLRTIGLRWPWATKQEAEEQISTLMERVGNNGMVLLCTDPDANAQRQRRLYFGPLTGNLGMVWNVGQRFEWRADLRSVI